MKWIWLKSLAVLVVYGLFLWMMRPLGWIGFIAALISGTSVAGIICLSRKHDVGRLLRLMIYMLIGGTIGYAILGFMFMPHSFRQGSIEVTGIWWTIVGVVAGAVIAMLVNDSYRPLLNHPPTAPE